MVNIHFPNTFKRKNRSRVSRGRFQGRGVNNALTLSGRAAVSATPLAAWNSSFPFPPSKRCQLKYSDINTLATGTSGLMGTEQIYRLNSLYDPDYSGTGHQPYMFDQLAAIYGKYFVKRVSFKVTFTDPSADSIQCCVMIQPAAGTKSLTGLDVAGASELAGTVVRSLNATGSQNTYVTQGIFHLSQLEGLTVPQYDAQVVDYGAAVGANPSLSPYMRMAIGNIPGNAGLTCRYQVEMVFDVEFYERLMPATS